MVQAVPPTIPDQEAQQAELEVERRLRMPIVAGINNELEDLLKTPHTEEKAKKLAGLVKNFKDRAQVEGTERDASGNITKQGLYKMVDGKFRIDNDAAAKHNPPKYPNGLDGPVYVPRLDSAGKNVTDEHGNPIQDLLIFKQGKIIGSIVYPQGLDKNGRSLGECCIHPDNLKPEEHESNKLALQGVDTAMQSNLSGQAIAGDGVATDISADLYQMRDPNAAGRDAGGLSITNGLKGERASIELIRGKDGKYSVKVPDGFTGVVLVPQFDKDGKLIEGKMDMLVFGKGKIVDGAISAGSILDAKTIAELKAAVQEKELKRDGATLASAELAASAAAGLGTQDPVLAGVLASNAKLAAPEPKVTVDDHGRPVQPVLALDGKAVPASEVGGVVNPLNARSAKDLFAPAEGGTTQSDLDARQVATTSTALAEAVGEEGGPGSKGLAGDKVLGRDGNALDGAAAKPEAPLLQAADNSEQAANKATAKMDAQAQQMLNETNLNIQEMVSPYATPNLLASQIRINASQEAAQDAAIQVEIRAEHTAPDPAALTHTHEHHAEPAEPPRDGNLALPGRGDSQAQPAQVEVPAVIHVEAGQGRQVIVDLASDIVSASLREAPDPLAAVQVAAAAPQSVTSQAELTAETVRMQAAETRSRAEVQPRAPASPPVGGDGAPRFLQDASWVGIGRDGSGGRGGRGDGGGDR